MKEGTEWSNSTFIHLHILVEKNSLRTEKEGKYATKIKIRLKNQQNNVNVFVNNIFTQKTALEAVSVQEKWY